jgi:hypothetical protein
LNLRHAAALALWGWYLMGPPSTLKSYTNPVDKIQPLSRWQKVRRFDSEHDCHRALKRLGYEGENLGETPATPPEQNTVRNARKLLLPRQAVSSHLVKSWWAQYIASDDPRLNP